MDEAHFNTDDKISQLRMPQWAGKMSRVMFGIW